MATRRKVNNLLALAVLGMLVQQPMHPYEIAATLREQGKNFSIKINWGSLYTVVQNLEKHGFVAATETSRQGRRPERTVYAITESGREELRDWLRELVREPEKEYHRFEAALSLIGVLSPDEVRQLLEQRLRALEIDLAGHEASLAQASRHVPRIFLIEVEYYLAVLRAEADWVRSLLREIADGSLPGVDAWRKYHETGELPAEFQALMERGSEPG
jgi:DNA-binding PadR family transcriptional regulator